jgi:hypothetical protein
VASVTSSTVTVKTASGSSTYAVTSATQILRNGAPAALSSLKAGEQVFLHVYSSGNAMAVERLFVGTPPQFGGHAGPGDGDPGAGGPTGFGTSGSETVTSGTTRT